MTPFRYHSHPIFAPKPSQKDNENQRNYQALFRCTETQLEPFVGAIVGPYDMQLPTQVCTACLGLIQGQIINSSQALISKFTGLKHILKNQLYELLLEVLAIAASATDLALTIAF